VSKTKTFQKIIEESRKRIEQQEYLDKKAARERVAAKIKEVLKKIKNKQERRMLEDALKELEKQNCKSKIPTPLNNCFS
jgi:replicative DNA helicase